jgi:MFS family permease
MLPLTLGFLVAGPVSGYLSDRYGARPFATGGMLLVAAVFLALSQLPVLFAYPAFALLLLAMGMGFDLFNSPNSAAVMNSVPAAQRGAAAGVRSMSLLTGNVLSTGIFFSLMITGLASGLPGALQRGLLAHDVPLRAARRRPPSCRPSRASSPPCSAATRWRRWCPRACCKPSPSARPPICWGRRSSRT